MPYKYTEHRSYWLCAVLSLLLLISFEVLATGHNKRPSTPLPGAIVDVNWLAGHRQQVVILDIGNTAESYADVPDYFSDQNGHQSVLEAAGHIPGARWVDYETTRVDRLVNQRIIKKQAPDGVTFSKLAQQWGINRGDAIVIVPRGGTAEDVDKAARLLWIFRRYGERKVAILDGGMMAWLNSGLPVSSGPVNTPPRGHWTASPEHPESLATADEAAAIDQQWQLVDVRDAADYAAGHIAGALSLPPEGLLSKGASKHFLSAAEYRQILYKQGINPDAAMIVYCKGGILAPGAWFVLEEILGNHRVRIFEGAMQQWQREGRPLVKE